MMSPFPALVACAMMMISSLSGAAGNLLPNSDFEQWATHGPAQWNHFPDQTKLIRQREEAGGGVVMLEGEVTLGLTSERFEVQRGEVYTLSLELMQEEIHIGFGMGATFWVLWERESGEAVPERLDEVDGSFDWERRDYSVTAPADAAFARVRLIKRGVPGKVSFRSVAFEQGARVRTKDELSANDYIRILAALEFVGQQLENDLADFRALPPEVFREDADALHRAIAEAMAQVRAEAKQLGHDWSKEQWDKVVWTEMLKGSQSFQVPAGFPWDAPWQQISKRAAALRKKVATWVATDNRERLREAMEKSGNRYDGYALGVDSTMLKLRREAAYTGKAAGEVRFSVARQEEEGAAVTLAALDRALEGMSLEVAPLRHEDGSTLSVVISRLDFIKASIPQYHSGGPGWWPDIVFPTPEVERVEKGALQPFWLSVAPEAGASAGFYRGELTVREGGKESARLPVEVEVWDLTLPKPGRFKVVGCFHPYMLGKFYGWKETKPEVVANWTRFITRKRWNPTLYFSRSITPSGEPLEAALDEGLNSINLIDPSKFLTRNASRTYQPPTPEQEKELLEALTKAEADLKAAGANATVQRYSFGFDEQHDRSQYPLMASLFRKIKAAVPGVKIGTTTTYPPLTDLAGVVDTWIPLLGSDSADLRERQAAGDELFFYVYAHPFRPYPNPSIIDYPGVDGRVTFWIAAQQGYSGFLHWLMNGWQVNFAGKERWPAVPWLPYCTPNMKARNGEGYFLYPGPEEQPLASVRFELMREGIEDWELITMLREAVETAEREGRDGPALAAARKALAGVGEIAPTLSDYTREPEAILAAREKVAHALMALNKEKK